MEQGQNLHWRPSSCVQMGPWAIVLSPWAKSAAFSVVEIADGTTRKWDVEAVRRPIGGCYCGAASQPRGRPHQMTNGTTRDNGAQVAPRVSLTISQTLEFREVCVAEAAALQPPRTASVGGCEEAARPWAYSEHCSQPRIQHNCIDLGYIRWLSKLGLLA